MICTRSVHSATSIGRRAKKLEDTGIKCPLLGYEASSQYRLWDIGKRKVIRATYVRFDEYTIPPSLEAEAETFHHAILGFRQITIPETSDPTGRPPPEPAGPQPNEEGFPDSADARDNFDGHRGDSDSEPGNNEPAPGSVLPASMPALSAPPALTPALPPPPAPAANPAPRRILRLRDPIAPMYDQVNNPWNPRTGGSTKSPRNERRAEGFAARIATVIVLSNEYRVPKTWKEAMDHPDAVHWMEAARVEFNHQKK